CFRDVLSHQIRVPSCPPVTSTLPSGEKATEVAPPACPSSSCNLPVSTSQRRMIPGRSRSGGEKLEFPQLTAARDLPLGEKARPKTWYMLPESERSLLPVLRSQSTTGSAFPSVRPPVASTRPSGEMATAKPGVSLLNFGFPVARSHTWTLLF